MAWDHTDMQRETEGILADLAPIDRVFPARAPDGMKEQP